MNRVTHFEITAGDPKRAAAFYERVFGWTFNDWGGPFPYLLATTGPKDEIGIDGAIMDHSPDDQAVIVTIGVVDWGRAASAVASAGGIVLQDKTAVPGQGWFAYCRDTEGTVFGIFEADPSAS